MIFAAAGPPRILRPMTKAVQASENWTEELVRFLCEQPGVGAVRVDPATRQVSIATIGQVNLADLESRLAATIAVTIVMARAAQRALAAAAPGTVTASQTEQADARAP